MQTRWGPSLHTTRSCAVCEHWQKSYRRHCQQGELYSCLVSLTYLPLKLSVSYVSMDSLYW